jgi:hypothetical protein
VSVVVEDIDPQGKISLSLIGDDGAPVGRKESSESGADGGAPVAHPAASAPASAPTATATATLDGPGEHAGAVRRVSFEDSFQSQLEAEFGDLGPADTSSAPREDRGPRRRGGPRR